MTEGRPGAIKTSDASRHAAVSHKQLGKKKAMATSAREAAHAGHNIFIHGSAGSVPIDDILRKSASTALAEQAQADW